MKKRIFTLSYATMLAWLFLIPATALAQLPNAPKADYSTKSGTFTDTRDGKTYAFKKYGNLDWFIQNLDWAGAPGDRGTAPFGSYLYTPGEGYGPAVDPDGSIFGRMYNIRTSTADFDGFCPDGWRLPVKSDWEQLLTDIAGEYELTGVTADNIGKYLKAGGTKSAGGLWADGTEIDAKSDEIGFNILPAGVLNYWRRNDTGYDNSTQIDQNTNLPRGDHSPGDIASFMLSGWAVNALKATDNNVLFPSNAGTELLIYSHHYGSVRCVRTAITTSTAEMEGQQNSKAFFNSNGNILTVVSSLPVNVVSVYDIAGKVVFHKQIDQSQLTLEVESNSWNSGIYIIKVQSSEGFESLKVCK